MTDTNPRDLIKRLADALHDAADDVRGWGDYASSYFQEKHDLPGNVARIYAEAAEAYAYLDQPEPEGPTDEEILAIAAASIAPYQDSGIAIGEYEPETERAVHVYGSELIAFAHAVEALASRPAVEPAPVNELVDLAHELRKTAEYLQGGCGWAKALDAIERAAILIESNALRLITPTPVSERPWERDEWCDNNGWCWGFDADDTDPYWSFDKPEGCPTWTHLLPHNALPLPVLTQQS